MSGPPSHRGSEFDHRLFEADQFLSGNVPGDVMADMAAELPEQRERWVFPCAAPVSRQPNSQ